MNIPNDRNKKLQAYIPLTKFLAHFLGKNCEVVLHDIDNVEQSIVAIENNHISGRKMGDPLKNLGSFFKGNEPVKADFIKSHAVLSKRGKRLKSASYFIRDENGELIGMLCLNMDVTRYDEIKASLDEYVLDFDMDFETLPARGDDQLTNDKNSIEDLSHSIIEETILGWEVSPSRMTPEEKVEVVAKLSSRGVFLLRGAISEVAELLETSENTIYRYLSKVTN